ncbi:ketoacyl-ACP synthase III family protein [Amycolatopsis sp. PS_44_ISF1]|uniref:ketoacyl-ACP synthase III family protein n=1 Tax=Amycolatopsis sp. PS_44_ISF1 TaxID=2974917 RepID=UPI0028DF67A6|nr:ketoacyl-ACP synthase III family protein [Amycolatopsis sp. PS_44_ISF1]MDT8912955.1 ketoacyl-ACP synthase III family protein [Amycolatopsis sp. PS_44_ISF1]
MVTAGLTVEAVVSHTPDAEVSIDDLAPRLGLTRPKVKLFRKIHGLDRLRLGDGGVEDLVAEPARRLLAGVDRDRVRFLVYAHTIQEVAPFGVPVAQRLGERLGLANAIAFALTQQNCAGGLAAIDVCGELLADLGEPDALAVVVTGEKAFSPLAQLIPNTAIMGEGSAACLVRLAGDGEASGDRVVSYAARTDGRFADGLRLSPERLREFGDEYAQQLTGVVQTALDGAGLSLAEVSVIVPHNVNRSSWRRAIELLGVPEQAVFLDNIAEYSHCFCSDPFLNYTRLRALGRLQPGDHYVLTAVGLGATYAAMVLRHGKG